MLEARLCRRRHAAGSLLCLRPGRFVCKGIGSIGVDGVAGERVEEGARVARHARVAELAHGGREGGRIWLFCTRVAVVERRRQRGMAEQRGCPRSGNELGRAQRRQRGAGCGRGTVYGAFVGGRNGDFHLELGRLSGTSRAETFADGGVGMRMGRGLGRLRRSVLGGWAWSVGYVLQVLLSRDTGRGLRVGSVSPCTRASGRWRLIHFERQA